MKYKKLSFTSLCLVVMCLSFLTACQAKQQHENTTSSFQVTDLTNREVSFSEMPKTIVALLPSDVEILYAIGAGEKLIGVGEYCDYPMEATSLPILNSGSDMNVEQVVALNPDVVIMGTMAQSEEQIAQLEQAGMQVIVTDSNQISDVYDAISLLGQLTGYEENARTLITQMQEEFDALKEQSTQRDLSVYVEISPLQYGLWSGGTNTFMQEICDILGVNNIFDDISGWAQVSQEQVLKRNPDYIFTTSNTNIEGMTPVEEIMNRTGWNEMNAITNSQVYMVDNDMLTRPGPRLVDAAKQLSSFLFGE